MATTSERERAVRQAVKKIRAFYQLGRKVRRVRADSRQKYDREAVRRLAEKHDLHEEVVRQAALFADPVDGYTEAELDELCALIEELQSGQEAGEPVFGRSHVVRLRSVRPKSERKALQEKAVRNAWSAAELGREISRRFGAQRDGGGRRRRVPRDAAGLLAQLEQMCESWRRWGLAASRKAGKSKKSPLESLGEAMRKRVEEAGSHLLGLQRAVVEELKEHQPRRRVRTALQVGENAAGVGEEKKFTPGRGKK